jgi:hypothetical protein
VLGFYPSEEMLDGKYHRLTVKMRNTAYHLNNVPAMSPPRPRRRRLS